MRAATEHSAARLYSAASNTSCTFSESVLIENGLGRKFRSRINIYLSVYQTQSASASASDGASRTARRSSPIRRGPERGGSHRAQPLLRFTARLKFLLQAIKRVSLSDGLTHECERAIVQKLLTVNTDFREPYKDNPASADPIVEIVGFDSEHFAANPQKIKNS